MFGLNGKSRKAVEILRKYRLCDYESKAYVSLLLLGESKVADISAKSNIPNGKIYYALQNLQRKRLVEKTGEFPSKFVALPFEIYLADYIKTRTAEIEKLRQKRIEFRQIICSLQPIAVKHQQWE